jgi:NTE family protein
MASGALPPGFPAIEIDGEYYWDGGVHSNSPLEVILEAVPPEDTLCFLIDCFGGANFLPSSMSEVNERVKDIRNSTHAQRTILNYLHRQKMRQAMNELRKFLSPKQLKEHQKLMDIGYPHHCTLVHIIYSDRIAKQASKDYNFDSALMERTIEIGYQNVQNMLEEKLKWGYVPEDNQSRLYEPPTNSRSSLLFRKKRGTD